MSASIRGGEDGREIVFVGGTGRSGTHILGRLIGHHGLYADVPIEARFHCHKLGFADLLEGRVTLATFMAKLRGFWWHRVRVDLQPRGLYNLMRRPEFDLAAGRFEDAFHDDPARACRELFCDLLWPTAERARKPGLVEMSSHNIREAQTLVRLFPRASFIHTVRDGRDAASSVVTKTWGPSRIGAAIGWWVDRLRWIDRGLHSTDDDAAFALPAGQFAVVLLDELVGPAREAEYEGLCAALPGGCDPAMRRFFDDRMSPEAANRGRWSQGIGRAARLRVNYRYERALRTLELEQNHAAPRLRAAFERSKLEARGG